MCFDRAHVSLDQHAAYLAGARPATTRRKAARRVYFVAQPAPHRRSRAWSPCVVLAHMSP